MKVLFVLLLFLFRLECFAQDNNSKDSFTYVIATVTGDLNKDNYPDTVIVSQDTADERAPYRLQIYFGQANRKSKLIVSSVKIIEPQYPEGKEGYRTGDRFSDITIKNRVLSINAELLRGHYEHKFRWQKGNFELIGFTEVYSNGQGEMYTTDFNLMTGIRVIKTERYDTDKIVSVIKKKILIRPLPKLQEISPRENEYY